MFYLLQAAPVKSINASLPSNMTLPNISRSNVVLTTESSTNLSADIIYNNASSNTSDILQSNGLINLTENTFLLVYGMSLLGIILLQLAKGFAGAKV